MTEDLPDNCPPDYPESAHEADANTHISLPDAPLPISPPWTQRGFLHRKCHSALPVTSPSADPYLMSNVLLQSSISTYALLSAVLYSLSVRSILPTPTPDTGALHSIPFCSTLALNCSVDTPFFPSSLALVPHHRKKGTRHAVQLSSHKHYSQPQRSGRPPRS